ncbi:DnaJ domain-containing protein [Mesorhizobium xinjiangense]|uniref:DnaJ domain-containing protein n=1 Tax=Mesorhizobium xinjiangense TaxID=2678685 RepID=UPI0012EE55A6|nr:DnaJ domain-containing protein [Mesorhizobium xinjiangense]
MTFAFYAVAVLLILFFATLAFVRSSPARIVDVVQTAGPIALIVVAAVMLLIGRVGLAGVAFSAGLGWWMSTRARRAARPTPGKVSTVRTAALEMELDHESGRLEGIVLAGRFEGRTLDDLSVAELSELREALEGDLESLQLLETYLDGRAPGWRDDAKADTGERHRSAPSSGAMTEQEAYQILGLEAGASPAEIRNAHRRLMQRLHPDLGGTSFLAARINEAKDVLLSGHG